MSDALCKNCGHTEDDHDGYGGLCDGDVDVTSRSQCGCVDFTPAAPVERGEPDAVREALVDALDHAPSSTLAYLAIAVGAGQTLDLEKIADALLALRATPAPSRGVELYPHDCGCETCPDHTPAPSGEAEPVAWVVCESDGAWRTGITYPTKDAALRMVRALRSEGGDGFTVAPLYRATPPSVPQVTEEPEDFDRIVAELRQPPLTNHAPDALRRAFVEGWHSALDALTAALTPQPKEGR